jgi:peroxiredoxin
LLIGKKAPQIILQDTSGNDISLYSLDKKFIVLLFWDVDCGHCKKEMPKIEAAYPELKELDAEVYAVYSQEEWNKWKKWLREHNYPWLNVGNVKLTSDFQSRYNIDQTPIIFILDENKTIIAKKIGADQIKDILEHHIELGKTKAGSN